MKRHETFIFYLLNTYVCGIKKSPKANAYHNIDFFIQSYINTMHYVCVIRFRGCGQYLLYPIIIIKQSS